MLKGKTTVTCFNPKNAEAEAIMYNVTMTSAEPLRGEGGVEIPRWVLTGESSDGDRLNKVIFKDEADEIRRKHPEVED